MNDNTVQQVGTVRSHRRTGQPLRFDEGTGMARVWSRTGILVIMMPVIVAALGLRLFHLDYHDLRGDEAFGVFFGQNDWAAIIKQSQTGEPHPPIYYFALKLWMSLAGQSEFAIRWPSAAAGVALVPLVFVFWRRMGNPWAGVIAATLVAANPYHIWHSQDARMYTLATTFSAGLIYCGLRVAGIGRPAGGRDALGLAVTSLLAMGTHYVAVIIVAAVHGVIALHWLIKLIKGKSEAGAIRMWVLSVGVTVLAYLPWLVVGLPSLGTSFPGRGYSPTPTQAVWDVLKWFSAGEPMWTQGADLLALGTLVAGCLGATAFVRRSPTAAALVVAGMLVPFVALLVASSTRPLFLPRYLVLTLPPLYLLVANGLAHLLPPPAVGARLRTILLPSVAILAGVGLVTLGLALQSYYLNRATESGTWRGYVGHIVSSAAVHDLVVVNHLDPAFSYYYQQLGGKAPVTTQPPHKNATPEDIDGALEDLMSPGRTVWFVADGVKAYDKKGLIVAWLNRRAIRLEALKVRGKDLAVYRVPAGEPQGVIFGDLIRLERYEIRGGQAQFEPGGDVTVDLLWRGVAPVMRDYTITLQLLDGQGRLVTQSDGPPANGRAPTSSWRTSEVIVDTRKVKAPDSPGNYQLTVAVYELASMRRLSVPGTPNDLVKLGLGSIRTQR